MRFPARRWRGLKPAGWLVACLGAAPAAGCLAGDYAGADACAACHQAVYDEWRESDHFHSMLPATEATVAGDFAGQTLEFHGRQYRFFKRDGGFFVAEGGSKAHELLYAFGHRPLQQYLVALTGGRLQAFNVAWDNRAGPEGQRWFHLRAEMADDSPFHWTRHLQNWNSRCADCHSTGVSKNFDAVTQTYRTTFSEVNVGCEACHGPAGEHVRSARAGKALPPLPGAAQTLAWRFEAGRPVAAPDGPPDDRYIDMCGGCHSRRAVIAEPAPGGRYGNQYLLSLLEAGLYHPDGQIQDEVFVLGSFLQSRMHARGVTCMNCHDAHSGRLRFEDNRLCAQCHNPAEYDVVGHLLHTGGKPGSMCVDCHMPATTYMRIDARRDHRFGIPNPKLTQDFGVPNACNGCHRDQSPAWAAAAIEGDIPDDGFTRLNLRVRRGDPLAVAGVAGYVANVDHPAIKRATLLAGLPVVDAAVRLASGHLRDDSELVRMAAARKIAEAPVPVRRALLPEVAGDSSAVVRRAAARGWVGLPPAAGRTQAGAVAAQVNEFRKTLAPTLDMPSSLTELALLEHRSGNTDKAIAALERAIGIEPHYLPAVLNLADIHRERQRDEQAIRLLARAVATAPDSGAAHHSYGLALVRQGDAGAALRHFETATRQADGQPRYAYVYAVALDSLERTDEAVAVLQSASRQWPNQYDLLTLEVLYREKAGLLAGIETPLRALAALAPDNPQIRRWLRRYRPD